MAPANRARDPRGLVVEYVSIRKVVERKIPIIRHTGKVTDLAVKVGIHDLASEALWVITLDGSRGVHGVYQVAQGGYHDATVSLPVLFGAVLASGTDRFVLVHNHPSGALEPTNHDVELTQRVADGSALLDLMFEDHVIVNPEADWFSFRGRKMLPGAG